MGSVAKSDRLNERQRLFVDAYLGDAKFQATEAARLAGYAHPDRSGPRLMTYPVVVAAIRRKTLRSAMSAEECLSRLAGIAGADLSDCLEVESDDKGRQRVRLNVVQLIARGHGYLIREIKNDSYGCVETVKLHDSLAALQTIAKHLGLLRDQVDVTVTEDTETIRARIMAKLARPGSN